MPYDLCVKNRQQNILIITVEEMLTDGQWGRDEKYISLYNDAECI